MDPDLEAEEAARAKVSIQVMYLSSYEHMGVVEVTCAAGCTCPVTRIDAHSADKAAGSPMVERLIRDVSQSLDCLLRIENKPESSSGEHKFKIFEIKVKYDNH